MYADRFSSLIPRYPQVAPALKKLADYFGAIERDHGARVWDVRLTAEKIYEVTQGSSRSQLGSIIAVLVSNCLLERIIIVESASGTSAGEYKNYSDVPDELHDENMDVVIEVTTDLISTIYRPRK